MLNQLRILKVPEEVNCLQIFFPLFLDSVGVDVLFYEQALGDVTMRRAYFVHPIGGAQENSCLPKNCRLARQKFGSQL